MSKDIQEAKNWLSALDIHSEYEATNKELILSHIETLEKENKKWEDYCTNDLEKQITDLNNRNFELENKLENSIPTEVIKEKIKELDKEEKEAQDSISDEEREEYSDSSIGYLLANIETRREVLQDLLENK